MAQDVVGPESEDSQMESPARREIFFAVRAERKAAERPGGQGSGRKERSGDDLGGLSKGREGARHEGRQGKHEAAEADQHWRGSLLRRVSDELKMALSHLGRSDRRYTAVQVGWPIIELRAFPWTGGAA